MKDEIKKGGTRKIADFDIKICRHPEHNPAGYIVRDSGIYEHECPACGQKQTFIVPPKPMMFSKCDKNNYSLSAPQ